MCGTRILCHVDSICTAGCLPTWTRLSFQAVAMHSVLVRFEIGLAEFTAIFLTWKCLKDDLLVQMNIGISWAMWQMSPSPASIREEHLNSHEFCSDMKTWMMIIHVNFLEASLMICLSWLVILTMWIKTKKLTNSAADAVNIIQSDEKSLSCSVSKKNIHCLIAWSIIICNHLLYLQVNRREPQLRHRLISTFDSLMCIEWIWHSVVVNLDNLILLQMSRLIYGCNHLSTAHCAGGLVASCSKRSLLFSKCSQGWG